MRLLFIFFLLVTSNIKAQSWEIKGTVENNIQEKMSDITVYFLDGNGNELHQTQTDALGAFVFGTEEEEIQLLIEDIRFESYVQNMDETTIQPVVITLKPTDHTLNEMVIQIRRPVLKRQVDRLEFLVENTPMQDLSAWDILRNTPHIIIQNEQITVRNNAQILVTINDKRTLLTPEELKQLLENTDGNQVSSVEVITNPPAKYEASGAAIVNIKMKKNELQGFKGQVYGRYHQSIYAKNMLGFSQSFANKKWQWNSNYSFVSGTYVRENYDIVTYDEAQTRWESDMRRKTDATAQHYYNLSVQYNPDTLSYVQIGINGSNIPSMVGDYRVPTNIYEVHTNERISHYLTHNHRTQFLNQVNAFLVYDRKWNHINLNWSNHFSHRYAKENQDVFTDLNFARQEPQKEGFASYMNHKIGLYATQADVMYNKDKMQLETGLRYSYVDNQSDLDFFEIPEETPVYQPEKSNLFHYREHIFAAYLSGNYSWEKWVAKAGIRSETSQINTWSENPYAQNRNLRTHIFPTVYLMYNMENAGQIGFSYGNRINRPNYSFLNPSRSYYNLFSYFQGDAGMKPTIIHNINLTYTIRNWNFEWYYRYEKDPAMEISIQNPATFETVYHFTNIKNGEAFGLNFSRNFSIRERWQFNVFAMAEYNSNYFYGTDLVLYKNDALFAHLNLNISIQLDKKETWSLTFGYVYNAPTVQGSFSISSSQNTFGMVSKKLLNKKLEINLTGSDWFRTNRTTITTRYADQNQSFRDYSDTQYLMLNIRYHFGNQKIKEMSAAKKAEEQGRL